MASSRPNLASPRPAGRPQQRPVTTNQARCAQRDESTALVKGSYLRLVDRCPLIRNDGRLLTATGARAKEKHNTLIPPRSIGILSS
ncbi:hypothetical protein ElyMa_005999600 [Elysia marginata]|uniref:Uncharacterized protein n=1 Tax=Elysia marginata TaxID=1093978 RepID=A0AAV4GFF9_9GAST|nr:hypothetical protein ElyMa_005999600 [Elysia marginata]